MRLLMSILIVSCLSACSITQEVDPTGLTKTADLCIAKNDAVKEGFLQAYRETLQDKGFTSRLIEDQVNPPEDCEWTSSYTANWSWDLSAYMSYAEIKIYHNGELDGTAIYDSRKGSGNMGKFINAADKVKELVNQLLGETSALSQYLMDKGIQGYQRSDT